MARPNPAASGVLLLLLWCCAAAGSDDAAVFAVGADWRQSVLELRVHGSVAAVDVVALRDAAGGLWLARGDFRRLPAVAPHRAQGREYFPVAALRGAQVSFDESRSEATLSVPADAFETSAVSLEAAARPPPSRSGTGLFLNYQLFGQTGSDGGTGIGSAYTELGAFSPAGVLTSSAVGTATDAVRHVVRLETTFSRDFPESLETLRLGDTINVPGSWARAVRFGGLQWGSNYAIRPDLITMPLLAATGTAVLPSTVEVFVNGREVGSSELPAGPFVVNQVPALTGSGTVNIVVRNALGQTEMVSVPFYASALMLQSGLSLYDIDLGAVRGDYGLASGDYGPLLASATWRHGFSSTLTGEIHAETLHGGPAATGLDFARSIDRWGIVSVDAAAGGQPASSGRPGTSGYYGALGLQHLDERLSAMLQLQRAGAGFREIGDEGALAPPRQRAIAQAGWNLGRAGTLAAAYVTQRNADDTRQRALGLTYTQTIGRGSLSANASRTTGDTHDSNVYLFYTLALGERRSASTSVRYDSQQLHPNAVLAQSLQQSVPAGVGDGYLLSAGTDGSYDAEFTRQAETLVLNAGAARLAGVSAQRLSLSGSTVFLDGELRAARTITDSFAMVEVGGLPDVTVYLDNQPVALTSGSGVALVPELRSYDINRLSIDPLQLPLDTDIEAAELAIVPPHRSGIRVSFPVRRVRSGLFRLRRADGTPVPAGAVVAFQGEEFPVGLDGLTYVTGYDHGTGGEARWNGGGCAFRLPPPPPDEPQPDLGIVVCASAP